jgi:prepilin-type N-terminal cleavage/methylation domain-containing protein
MKRFSFLRSTTQRQPAGYTLLELLIVILILGILAAIVSPSLITWLNNQRVGAVRSQISDAMRKAQNEAKRTKINRELRFRFDQQRRVNEYAIIPAIDNGTGQPTRLANVDPSIKWQTLADDGGNRQGLQLRMSASPLPSPNAPDGPNGTSAGIVFNPYGAVVVGGSTAAYEGDTNSTTNVFTVQVTVNGNQHKRCVVVRTLLGAFREEKNGACPNL